VLGGPPQHPDQFATVETTQAVDRDQRIRAL
jgi:hypothetical protein